MKKQTTVLFSLSLISAMLMPHCSLAFGLDRDAQAEQEKAALQALQSAHAAEEDAADFKATETAPRESGMKNPVCNMEATVTSVEANAANPAYYVVKTEIKNITVSQATSESACDGAYQRQLEKAGQIMKASDYQSEPVKAGDDINARVQFAAEEGMQGYFLSNVAVTSSAAPAAEANDEPGKSGSMEKKEDSTKTLIGAFGLVTLLMVAGIIYASRDKSKKA